MKKIIFTAMLVTLASCGGAPKAQGNAPAGAKKGSLSYQDVPANAEFVLTTSHDHNTEGYNHLASLVFKAAVENKSNGRIGIKIYPNGQLAASGKEGVTGLVNGTLDIFKVTGDLAAYWAPAAVFDLPYVFSGDRVAEAVYGDYAFVDEIRKDILKKQPKLHLMMIASSGGWRSFATTKKEVHTPSDLKGLKIRTVPAKVQQDLVSSMGAVPTAMPYAEIYTSLSTGVVDGANLSMVDIVNAKLHESLHYYVLDNHSYLAAFWFINSDKLASMPEDLQKIVVDSFEDMRTWLNSFPKLAQVAAYEEFRAKGGKIYTPSAEELKLFKEATAGLKDTLIAQSGEEVRPWIAKLEQYVARHEAALNTVHKQEMRK
ncbi:MAG: TRAP transporter substrate-binding protein DctP [Brevinema sp.]